MANSTAILRTFLTASVRNSFFYFLVVAWAAGSALAQTSVTDGSTPLALSPGAPAGSYALSGFESVNAYNGNLSFRLPLMRIGGRGEAGYTISLPIERHWRVVHKSNDNQEIELPMSTSWMATGRRYEAGHLEGRLVTDMPCTSLYHNAISLSRLTFTTSDGTEYELRDQLTGGQPQSYYCGSGQTYPSRGTVFVTADGTAATFISDTTILDDASAMNPSGYLSLRDGNRYRIDAGNVSWIRDRNGNKLSFSYGPSLMTITDSLNRQVLVQYADFQTTFFDQITFKGYGGAQRNIRINFALLHTVLRTNRPGDLSTVQTAAALFPQLTGSNSTPVDGYMISSVILPDGVQQFQLLYNVYGELARATLPTGGAFEYDFGNGTTGEDLTGVIWNGFSQPEIYRRVLRRRTYLDSGSTLESLTTYSRPELDSPGYVEINHFKSDQTTLLARERHYFHGHASSSFSQAPLDYAAWRDGHEYQTEYYAANGQTLLKKVIQTWDQRILVWWPGSADNAPANNPFIKESQTTLADSGQVTKTTHINPQNGQTMIDQFNNVTDAWVYDYGPGSPGALLNHTHTDFLTVNNGIDYTNRTSTASPHLLSLPTRQSIYDAGEIERARTTYEYDNYGSSDNYHTGLKDWPAITGFAISGLDGSFTSSYPYRGNVTATTRYLLTNNQVTGSIAGYAQYDLAGNVVKTIDPRSSPANVIATTISYDDCFGAPDAEARTNSVPDRLAAVNQRSFAFPTVATNALGQSVFTQFDYYLGRPVNAEDANGTVFSGYYDDLLDRPVKIIKASNRDISLQSQSLFTYDDIGHSVTTSSDLYSFGDQTLKDQVFYDGLGRTVETRQFEGGGNYIATRRLYDALGRVYQSSNPFRPWKNELPAWITTGFDGLSRVISQTTADAATATISYNGNTLTATDQIGRKRKSVSDALGRLNEVYEDPNGVNWLTSYTYDALGDLIAVNQGGQTRTFVYDSLTRLLAATNPENGAVTNTYDNNGNLLTRRDARNVTTNLAYDALNRPTAKTYQNDPSGSAPVSFFYDGQSLPTGAPTNFLRGSSTGRLVAVTYGNNASEGDYYGYDALGRSVAKVQRTGATNYQSSATYSVSGRVSSLTYPSLHTLALNYDQAGRLSDKDAQNPAMAGNLGDGVTRTYSSGIAYSSWNSLAQEKFGTDTPVYNKLFYNSRGQLSEIRESTSPNNTSWNRGAIVNNYSNQCWGMCAGQSMTDNNGNMKRQDIYIPNNDQVTSYASWADAYSYDDLNRLTQVHEYTGNTAFDWQQEYVYDRWGNRTIHQSNTWGTGIPKPDLGVNTSNNRLTAPAGYTMSYDATGNLTNDTYTSTGQRTYDAENRMTSAQGSPYWSYYVYDGEGQRIKRKINNLETWQVYGIGGELLAEYPANGPAAAPQKEYGYRNGQLLVTAGADAPSASAATFLVTDTATQGNWKGVYGADGYNIINDVTNYPAYAQVSVSGQNSFTWAASTGDVRALRKAASTTDRLAACWYSATNFTVDVNLTDGKLHRVAVYALDWNGNNIRSGRIEVLDAATDAVLDTRALGAYSNGKYFVWHLRGHVKIKVSHLSPAGWDQVISGLFFDPAPNTSASFVNMDTTTQGNWKGIYGADGYQVINDATSYPSYAQVSVSGQNSFTWAASTGDSRALRKAAMTTDRIAACWYSATNFTIDVNLTDGNAHRLAIYALDWNGNNVRTGKIEVLDAATNAVLDSQPLSSYTNGKYFVWQLRGHVKIKVSHLSPANWDTVISGLFFDAGTLASGTSAEINWLVTDQLGTPRMIFDKTGSLSNTKRHDYLPFGEELSAGTGQRSTMQGYSVADGVRQKFTQKERDNETGLDFFLARYYSSTQGRFTSTDPILIMEQKLLDPQQWNMYGYARSNPVRYVDPSGMYICSDGAKCDSDSDKAFEAARQRDLHSSDKKVRQSAQAYGDPAVDNRVYVGFAAKQAGEGGEVSFGVGKDGKYDGTLHVTFSQEQMTAGSAGGQYSLAALDTTVAHEGQHVRDDKNLIDHGYDPKYVITHREAERRAYDVSERVVETIIDPKTGGHKYNPEWQGSKAIDKYLDANPLYHNLATPIIDTSKIPQKTKPK